MQVYAKRYGYACVTDISFQRALEIQAISADLGWAKVSEPSLGIEKNVIYFNKIGDWPGPCSWFVADCPRGTKPQWELAMLQSLILNKKMPDRKAHTSFIQEDWSLSHSTITLLRGHEIDSLEEARNILGEAERVIAAQEERIKLLENLALTDELTGLLNRRGLLLSMQRELAAARRDPSACGVLIMLDLDGFKQINDMWGHSAGDDYLQTVAHTLLGEVRAKDVVARIGGDEFAILLTNINKQTGTMRVDKLEKSFNSRMTEWNNKVIPLRGSFGLAPYNGSDEPESVLASADLKLYAHKARRAKRGS